MPYMMFLSFRSIECKRKGDKRGWGVINGPQWTMLASCKYFKACSTCFAVDTRLAIDILAKQE